jgi:hypothetical protein
VPVRDAEDPAPGRVGTVGRDRDLLPVSAFTSVDLPTFGRPRRPRSPTFTPASRRRPLRPCPAWAPCLGHRPPPTPRAYAESAPVSVPEPCRERHDRPTPDRPTPGPAAAGVTARTAPAGARRPTSRRSVAVPKTTRSTFISASHCRQPPHGDAGDRGDDEVAGPVPLDDRARERRPLCTDAERVGRRSRR